MLIVFGDSCPVDYVIKFCSKKFKPSRKSLKTISSAGGLFSQLPMKAWRALRYIFEDRRIKQLEIARDVGISKEREPQIIHEHLDISKLKFTFLPSSNVDSV